MLEDDNDYDSSDEVSAPLKSKHLRWNCLAPGPKTDFPIAVSSLIDSGAHLVLIRPDLVDNLGLPRLKLQTPEIVDVALNDKDAPSRTELREYVKLKLFCPKSSWTSRTVLAVIAPGLCAPIILGLPFLKSNHIVVDHAA